MARPLSLLANAILFVLCAFLIANIANAIFAAMLTPAPAEAAIQPSRAPQQERSWEDRQVILTRNLFNASLLAPTAPAPPPEEEEELEATRLPLTLLGTVAADDPDIAWAAIEDVEERRTLVVRTDDEVKRNATVVRIERRRVVLNENGALRELALDDDKLTPKEQARRRVAQGNPRRSSARSRRGTAGERVRRLARDRYEVPREEVEQAVRNPGSIFSQAQIQPKYEEGQMLGMQINAIQEGSLFEEIGMQDGDVITELNGIQITSPEESAKILAEFAQASEFIVVVEDESGGSRTLNFTLPEE